MKFISVYALGLVFVVIADPPAAGLLLLGAWLWLQALPLAALRLVFPPAETVARLRFAGASWRHWTVVWAHRQYDRWAIATGQIEERRSDDGA